MTTAVSVPQLRGAGKRAWGICVGVSLITSMTFAVWFKYRVLEPRKRQYNEFYDKWDDDKEFAAMQKAGIFKGFEPS